MFSKTTFCSLPWSSIQINPSGNFKICCFSGNRNKFNHDNHGIGKGEDGNVMNILTHSISEALNSDLHKELRLAQSRNERHDVCRVCWDKEDSHIEYSKSDGDYKVMTSGAYSYRIGQTFVRLKDHAVSMEEAPKIMSRDGSIDNIPISLDIRFSNLCNAKCIQCSPTYSSLWYSDHVALTGSNEFNVGPKSYKIRQEGNKFLTDMVRWHDSPIWWEQFELIKHRLKRIYITGGEPFLQPSHDEMLDRFISADLAKDVSLTYDTNLTAINDKILNRLKHFKDVRLGVSVDDTHERYELIRYPCSWEKLLSNMERIREYKNLNVTITSCVGIFDIYAPMRLYSTFAPLGYEKFSYRILRFPECYDMANFPEYARKQIISNYDNSDIPMAHKAMVIGYIKNSKRTDKECQKEINKYVARMDALDKLRGTDWRTTFPETVELLRGYI